METLEEVTESQNADIETKQTILSAQQPKEEDKKKKKKGRMQVENIYQIN